MRELLRGIIKERGLSMAALSRGAGKSHAYLQQFLERGVPEKLPEDVRRYLSITLGIEESILKVTDRNVNIKPFLVNKSYIAGPNKATRDPEYNARNIASGGLENLLKVLGMAEGGPDGWQLFNGETIEYIQRPDNLRGVPGAYGVYVRGESMSPRYEPGEIAHIHPGKPIPPGAYVLVQRRNPDDETRPFAVIKRLVRRTANKVTLSQLNPAKQFDVPANDILSIHKIVGSSEA